LDSIATEIGRLNQEKTDAERTISNITGALAKATAAAKKA
jgi:hypothetical protein